MRVIFSLILCLGLMAPMAHAEDYPWHGLTQLKRPVDLTTVSIEDSSGKMMGLGAWRGKWVILNTWATWCAPCVAELPTLQRLAGLLNKPNLRVIAVSQDGSKSRDDILKFLDRHNISDFAAYRDSALMIDQKLKAPGLPMTYLINPEGQVIAEYRGAADWASPEVLQDLKRAMR